MNMAEWNVGKIKDMKTMMKKPAYLTFLSVILALLVCSCSSKKSITLLDYGNECETEWNDGKLWAYKVDGDYMVGISIDKAKDAPDVFQANILVKNNTGNSIVFDPSGISVLIANGAKKKNLDKYDYLYRKNINMATYSQGENIYLLSKISDTSNEFDLIGYLKRNTIYKGKGIIGYLNFDLGRYDDGILAIVIPIGDKSYGFQWHIGKLEDREKVFVSPDNIDIVDYSNEIEKKRIDDVLWACRNTGNSEISAALCTSPEDRFNYQLKLSAKSLIGHKVEIDADSILAVLAEGKDIVRLRAEKSYSYRENGVLHTIVYIERSWRDKGVLKVDIPVDEKKYTFQWNISNR